MVPRRCSLYLVIFVSFIVVVNFTHFILNSRQNRGPNVNLSHCKCHEFFNFSNGEHSSSSNVMKIDTWPRQILTNTKSNGARPSLISSKEDVTAKGQQEEVLIDIEAQSDKKNVYVAVNNKRVYEINELLDTLRGLHVIVLNQYNGNRMASIIFDFYGGAETSDLVEFLNSLHPGRVVVCLIKDEGSLGFKKKKCSEIIWKQISTSCWI